MSLLLITSVTKTNDFVKNTNIDSCQYLVNNLIVMYVVNLQVLASLMNAKNPGW